MLPVWGRLALLNIPETCFPHLRNGINITLMPLGFSENDVEVNELGSWTAGQCTINNSFYLLCPKNWQTKCHGLFTCHSYQSALEDRDPLICVSQGTALYLAHQRSLLTGWGMTHYINEALDGREHVLIISVSLDSVEQTVVFFFFNMALG